MITVTVSLADAERSTPGGEVMFLGRDEGLLEAGMVELSP
jgi:hypothetical protein